jgi:hypothetical protein
MIKEPTINVSQLQGIVKERNEYRRLLDECLYILNSIPNKKVGTLKTYDLASKIDDVFRRFQ